MLKYFLVDLTAVACGDHAGGISHSSYPRSMPVYVCMFGTRVKHSNLISSQNSPELSCGQPSEVYLHDPNIPGVHAGAYQRLYILSGLLLRNLI